jgi:hypothetical protein
MDVAEDRAVPRILEFWGALTPPRESEDPGRTCQARQPPVSTYLSSPRSMMFSLAANSLSLACDCVANRSNPAVAGL